MTNEQNSPAVAGPVERRVIHGTISYGVYVNCPNCGRQLNLNNYPYTDDETEYCNGEDLLGLALFGTNTKPAVWENMEIEYKCCGCKNDFTLNELQI